MSEPIRVQLRRTKGWRMPSNTVKVTRPGPFGNPFHVGGYFTLGDPGGRRGIFSMIWCESRAPDPNFTLIKTNEQAVDFYRRLIATHPPKNIESLRGKNLACWCPLGSPCHADLLLELANK